MKEIFTESFQKEFWKNIQPNLMAFISEYEKKEDWTYSLSEFPELFDKFQKELPEIIKLPFENETIVILENLINILYSMPFKHSITAILWLEDQNKINEIGWGKAVYLRSKQLQNKKTDEKIQKKAKIILERVNIMLKSNISTKIFTGLTKEEVA